MAVNYKQQFQKSEFAKGWTDLMDSVPFQTGATAAMMQFVSTFESHSDMASAAANEWRRQGAVQFLSILMNLAVNFAHTAPPTGQSLDFTR